MSADGWIETDTTERDELLSAARALVDLVEHPESTRIEAVRQSEAFAKLEGLVRPAAARRSA